MNTENIKKYFKICEWKEQAIKEKTEKLAQGKFDFVNPESYDVAINHYKSLIQFDLRQA